MEDEKDILVERETLIINDEGVQRITGVPLVLNLYLRRPL